MKPLRFSSPLAFALLLTLFCRTDSRAQSARSAPYEVSLPTAQPSGDPVNDRIRLTFYPAGNTSAPPGPAVVLLHLLGEVRNGTLHRFARHLAQRGIAAAVMTLPYHMRRRPAGDKPVRHFLAQDVDTVVQAFSQSASDVSTVISWLSRQPSVDPQRIGGAGISLGAIILHLVMGQDARLKAGVALLGGGNLWEMYQSSLATKLFAKRPNGAPLTAAQLERLRAVDPISYAAANRPRRVLMIQAARDLFLPPRNAIALWEALGRPPIQWLDINHLGLGLAMPSAMKTTAAYLEAVLNGRDVEAQTVPHVRVPTLKVGTLIGLDAAVTPALTWQAHSFATRRDHLSLLHADVGWSGRGPFIGLAATLNAFADIGVGRRLSGRAIRPYASLHVVF